MKIPRLKFIRTRVLDQQSTRVNLVQFRTDCGLLPASVARQMGVSPAFLSRLESGKRNWSEAHANAYIDAVVELSRQ